MVQFSVGAPFCWRAELPDAASPMPTQSARCPRGNAKSIHNPTVSPPEIAGPISRRRIQSLSASSRENRTKQNDLQMTMELNPATSTTYSNPLRSRSIFPALHVESELLSTLNRQLSTSLRIRQNPAISLPLSGPSLSPLMLAHFTGPLPYLYRFWSGELREPGRFSEPVLPQVQNPKSKNSK